jgi:predicted nucleic-acid-binding protein
MQRPWLKKTSESVLGVDTNVLVRFLTDDDDLQTPQAHSLVTKAANHPIYVSMLVLAETYNVLTKVKKQPVQAVLESFRLLLHSPAMRVERPDMVSAAIEDAAETKAGFSDALIAMQNKEARCMTTATFDIRATRLPDMSAAKDFV